MQYTEQELTQLIKTLEVEFSAHVAEVTAQPAPLAKAEDEKPAKESKEAPKASKEDGAGEQKESKPESKESESKEAPKSDESAEAKPEGAPAAPSEEQPTGEAPVAPSADEGASGYDAEDIAHMDQMYMSMSKAELLAHHDSCVRALDAQGAEHVHAQAPNAQAAAAPAAPAAPEIDKCGDMSMVKSEKQAVVSTEITVPATIQANPETEMLKSEIAASKAKNEELQKSLDTVSEFLTKLVKKAPQGRAITAYEQVAKSEGSSEEKSLSKGEIDGILLRKSSDPKLSKADRDAINAFYLNKAELNTISHLLK